MIRMKKRWGILVSADWLSLFKLIKHTTHFVLNLLFFCKIFRSYIHASVWIRPGSINCIATCYNVKHALSPEIREVSWLAVQYCHSPSCLCKCSHITNLRLTFNLFSCWRTERLSAPCDFILIGKKAGVTESLFFSHQPSSWHLK